MKGFSSKRIALKVDVLYITIRLENILFLRRIRTFFSPKILQAGAVKGLMLRFYRHFCPIFLYGSINCFASFILHILTHCGTVGLRLPTGWLSDFTHGNGGRGFLPHVRNQLGATPSGEQREGWVQWGRFPMSRWFIYCVFFFFSPLSNSGFLLLLLCVFVLMSAQFLA